MKKLKIVVINSPSRSGGTYVTSLFDGLPSMNVFPMEITMAQKPVLDFIGKVEFEKIRDYRHWLDETGLSYIIKRLKTNPYGRMLRREKLPGDPDVCFDHVKFMSDLPSDKPDSPAVMYDKTFNCLLSSIKVNNIYSKTDGDCFVSHFSSDTIPDYGRITKDGIDLHLITVIRDPYEQIISLMKHCQNIFNEKHREVFIKMVYARWRLAFYKAQQNKKKYPKRCTIIHYHPDPEIIRKQFLDSNIDLLCELSAHKFMPTALGMPLKYQSYKEKRGGRVDEPYDHEKLLTEKEREYIHTEREKCFSPDQLPDYYTELFHMIGNLNNLFRNYIIPFINNLSYKQRLVYICRILKGFRCRPQDKKKVEIVTPPTYS